MHNDRDILLVSVFTFLTILSWILFELIKTVKTTTVTANVEQIITQLSPKIETQLFTTLQNKQTY